MPRRPAGLAGAARRAGARRAHGRDDRAGPRRRVGAAVHRGREPHAPEP